MCTGGEVIPMFGFHVHLWLEGTVGEKHRKLARIPAVLLQEAAEAGPLLIVAPWLTQPSPASRVKSMAGLTGGRQPLTTHLAHCDGIIFRQDDFWGVGDTSELELVGRLAILPVTQDFAGSLHLLNLDGANGNPSDASQPLKISFVDGLETKVLSIEMSPRHPGV